MSPELTTHELGAGAVQTLSLDRLRAAEWNANRCAPAMLDKVRRSIEHFGVVENLVARPHPDEPGAFEVISGNHRLQVLAEMGFAEAPVVVVDVDDADARILAQTLNRTRGKDDPKAYARLLEEVLTSRGVEAVTEFLPETETTIDRILGSMRLPDLEGSPGTAESRVGEVYKLGPHRLVCGDARDPGAIAELLEGQQAGLLWTDPPYGVSYVGKTAAALTIENDEGGGRR